MFANDITMTPSPNSTSAISLYGASFAGRSAMEPLGDRVCNDRDLALRHPGEDRQGEQLRGEGLGDRERAGPEAEPLVGTRAVRRLGIVASAADATLGEERR